MRVWPDAKDKTLTTFTEFGLAEPLLKAISETGYETPTPIQLQAIPPVMTGKDVLGIAQTGTGKTAAFALPILHRLAADRRPTPRRGTRCLVLSPTRELATQIADSFRTYGKHLGFSVTVVFGGVSERPQIDRLSRGVDILVATPGRLLDHLSQRNLGLDMAEIFVLDEADQMLDLGFFKPIRRIVSHLPKVRQNLFFSATMPKEIEELTRELLNAPVKIAVAPESTTVERVSQRVMLIEQNKKKALLTELLADKAMQRTLVFTRTKRGADRVAKHLVSCGIDAAAIHGNKSQNQRELALANFRDGKCRVLVATDIAARGIDIDEVTHVVNYELPEVPEAYVHRIGRTARAGASGAALSLCDGGERHLLRDIERVTRQTIETLDRRNDANLASDRPGNDASHTPRGGQQQRGSGRGSSGRGEGRGHGGRGEGGRGREDRPSGGRGVGAAGEGRGRGGPRHGGGDRSERPERSSGERSSGERSGGERFGGGERPSFGAPRGDGHRDGHRGGRSDSAPRGDREGGARDAVWTNHGDRPDRQHREFRSDRATDERGPRPPRFGDTGREGGREPAREGDRRDARPAPRSSERGADRPAYNKDRGGNERGNDRSNDRSNDRGERPQHGRPQGERRDGQRGEARHEGNRNSRSGGPQRNSNENRQSANAGADRARPRPVHGKPTAPGFRERDERSRSERTD